MRYSRRRSLVRN